MELDDKSPWPERAKRAYTAYGKVTDFKNYQGLPMPEWESLTPTIQQAWIAATQQVAFDTEAAK